MGVNDNGEFAPDCLAILDREFQRRAVGLSGALRERIKRWDAELQRRLSGIGFDADARRTFGNMGLGTVIWLLEEESGVDAVAEQFRYSSRRLVKLSVSPPKVREALAVYAELVESAGSNLPLHDSAHLRWLLSKVSTAVRVAFDAAVFEVREIEMSAIQGLFRAELESRETSELLERFLGCLMAFSGAEAGTAWLRIAGKPLWVHSGSSAFADAVAAPSFRSVSRPLCLSGTSASILVPSWRTRYQTVWSVPLLVAGRTAGVMQFAFPKRYRWLPREKDLLVSVAGRCVTAAEKTCLLEDLAASEQRVRKLSECLMHVEETERRRISRELHDEAGQSLLWMRLQLELLEKRVDPSTAPTVTAVREAAERAIAETRRLIAALSPSVLDQAGLEGAVRLLVRRLRAVHPCRVQLETDGFQAVGKKTSAIVYRLLQECCNNIAKHSGAVNVHIQAETADSWLRLAVRDDGAGFDVEKALERGETFGLAGMRERVELLGGRFHISSRERTKAARSGTKVCIELPLAGVAA